MENFSLSTFRSLFQKKTFHIVSLIILLLSIPMGLYVLDHYNSPSAKAAPSLNTLAIQGDQFLLNGQPFDMWGVRVGSASQTEEWTEALIANLDDYKAHGVNTVTVFYMGTSGGHYDPFTPDGTGWRDVGHRDRMNQIIEAADARGMVVVVGIFYQHVSDKSLANWTASQEAVRTVVREMNTRGYKNIIINIANEQSSGGYTDDPWQRVQNPTDLLSLVDIAHQEDPTMLVGAGGFSHANNDIIGASPSTDALLFDTVGTEDSENRYNRFVNAGVVNKPIVNVEQFGGWSETPEQGIMTDAEKNEYYLEIDRAYRIPGLYTFFHYNSWFQGEKDNDPNRFDLAGYGVPGDPGVRWYFEKVRDTRTQLTATPTPTTEPGQPTSTPIPSEQYIESFMLINSTTHADIMPLTEGTTVDLALIPGGKFNIRANTNPAKVGSVRFEKNGKVHSTENSAPYELEGDNGSWMPTLGIHTLKATPYSGSKASGTAGTSLFVSFTVTNATSPTATYTPTPTRTPTPVGPTSTPTPTSTTSSQAVISLTLINAGTDQDIGPLIDGSTLSFSALGTNKLNIRANTNPTIVGSVRFAYDSITNFQTETGAPYAFAGNSGSNYANWTPTLGTHTVTATPYSGANASGITGTPHQVTFTVTQ